MHFCIQGDQKNTHFESCCPKTNIKAKLELMSEQKGKDKNVF